ncbi:S-adenosyl-L-methionine-dependent methyltransferase [Decorospora gaudefroyi]|uniref:S-adenosyl-L-methionine-dependent methyltransferase n=1 Tax=Decorospora gaudefroyi TaxID=184978 RepID=A0A6A5K4P1_9PLEO|nr:S-adenosyl-L-methionine-dependent methyltransferase [Decorospora gaudefroyi]
MAFNTQHQPKQAAALLEGDGKVSVYEATGGAVTAQFAANNLSLLDPIPPDSIVHDNCCGAGTVSRLILTSNPPHSNIKIHATDIDQKFLDVLQADVLKNSWPIEVSNQRSEALPFRADSFTHSITNIGIFFTSSAGLDGTKEIRRTLQTGGTAVVNCWETITWLLPLKLVHEALRPGKPYPAPPLLWNDGKQIKKVMLEAGFEMEEMRVEKSEAWARTSDIRDWAEKTWAFLGGLGGWTETDEERWDEAVDLLVEHLLAQPGTKTVDGEVWMRASQWIVIATK